MTSSTLRFLDARAHLAHGCRPTLDYGFAKGNPAIGVQLAEIGPLSGVLPLAFARQSETDYVLTALHGFADGHNLLVDEQGRWLGTYLPMGLRAYPLTLAPLAPAADGALRYGLAFQHASGLYREAPDVTLGERRFFDDAGNLKPWLARHAEMLQASVAQRAVTARAVEALRDAQLLTPWQLDQPDAGEPERRLPPGLYRVNEERLKALTGPQLQPLHQANALALAYAQLLSMGRVQMLHRLAQGRDRRAALTQAPSPAANPAPAEPGALEQLIGAGQSDTIRFNW